MLVPFFDVSEGSKERKTKVKLSRRNQGTGGCGACGLWEGCKSPKMEATGDGRAGILIIAEAPGKDEDKRGIQLVGKSGRRLSDELDRLKIDLDTDCRKINAVNCRPKDNRTPTDREVAFCRHKVMAEIQAFKPRVILALGGPAMKSLCQHRSDWDKGFPGIMNWQGACIPDFELGAWIVPTWHPAFIERKEGHAVYERNWRRDLRRAVSMLDAGAPEKIDYAAMCEAIIAPELAVMRLETLYDDLVAMGENAFVAFDYETTGLKPYVEGHRAVCISFCASFGKSMACMLSEQTWPLVERILRNPKIRKCAHNMKFEKIWTKIRGRCARENKGFDVRRFEWDCMLAAHVLDNRTGRTGLKFQSYINFGVLGYDDVVGPYLKAEKKGGNALNRIHEVPVRELLQYCAMDSLLEFHLAYKQIPLIAKDKGLTDGYNLMHKGALALADAEMRGVHVDLDYYDRQKKHLDRRIQHLRNAMLEHPEVKIWRKMAGDAFNINSAPQLAKLLSVELGLRMEKETAGGGVSVDKGVLEKIERPFVKDLLQIRKLEKIKSTYVEGFVNEAPDGVLHPFFNLHTVVSYRSSCLAKGTHIAVFKGGKKEFIPIERIVEGDLVFCVDDELKKTIRRVVWAGSTGIRRIIRVHFLENGSPSYIDLTPEHKVRMTDGVYVEAMNLPQYISENEGVWVLSYGLTALILKIEELDEAVPVYDIQVEEFPNFFANGLCVHNSDKPNFQNIPKHDSEANRIVRRGLNAGENYLWFEVDYSGIEVRIGCSYHKDPTLMNYLTDPSADMHRDSAMDIFILEKDEVTKPIRHGGKNCWVFPQFYGDYYGNCAVNLWADYVLNNDPGLRLKDGTTLKQHLARRGIKNYDKFEKHLKKVEDKFWGDRFPVYKEWRDENYADYLKKGFIRGHVGFIYSAIMSKNDVNNYGTQGSAFHCLLRSFIKINEELKNNKWKSYLFGQIHDSADGAAHPEEINALLPMFRRIMIDDLLKEYTWINTPMDVDLELSPIGKSWYELQTVKQRPRPCKCGLEWGYCDKTNDGGVKWTCPVCAHAVAIVK